MKSEANGILARESVQWPVSVVLVRPPTPHTLCGLRKDCQWDCEAHVALTVPTWSFGRRDLQRGSSGIITFVQMKERRLREGRLCAFGPWLVHDSFGIQPSGNLPQWLGAKLTSSAWGWDFTVVIGRRGDWSSALGNISFEERALDGETPEVVSSSHRHWLTAIS